MSAVDRHVRGTTLWSGPTHVRVRPMTHDPAMAFMAITGSHHESTPLPERDHVHQWCQQLMHLGFDRVRTNALGPGVRDLLAGAGFTSAQELVLYSSTHWTPPRVEPLISSDTVVRRAFRVGTAMWPALRREILALDTSSFGGSWCLDEGLLDDAMRATARSTLLISRHERRLNGFVIVGVSGDMGYVQRLAVHPDHRHRGVGTALVGHAVRWAARRGARQSMVNTEVTNVAARALYEKMGFTPLPTRLTVLHKELR